MQAAPELRQSAYYAFVNPDLEKKMSLAFVLIASTAIYIIANIGSTDNAINYDTNADAKPGIPAKPLLLEPLKVEKRSPFTPAGHAALMHSICHIEFNAVKTVYNECIVILMAYFDKSLQLHQVFKRQTGAWRFSSSARKASCRLCS